MPAIGSDPTPFDLNNTIDPDADALLLDENVHKNSEGFRIKKAANTAFKILAAIAVVVGVSAGVTAGVLAFVASSSIALPIATIVAATAAVALALLLSLKAWEKITPHLPKFLRVPANYIQSSVMGIASAVALGIIWPINYEKSNPKPEDINPEQPLRIAIHGFCGSSNNWMYHFKRYREAGIDNLASINLGNWCKSIDDYVDKVHEMVVNYKTGMVEEGLLDESQVLHVQFVCHSMGGLVARHYNQKYSKEDGVVVDDICTLGTPLDGTGVAYLAPWSKAGRQMFKSSSFVQNQQEQAANPDETTRYYHLASKCDYVIRPLVSATRGNAPPDRTKVEWLDATGHISYLFSDTAASKIAEYLSEPEHKFVSTAVAV